MDGMQMYTVLSQEKTTSPYFQGVYSRDTLPPLQKNMCAIVKSDDSSQPGTHCYTRAFGDGPRERVRDRAIVRFEPIRTLMSLRAVCRFLLGRPMRNDEGGVVDPPLEFKRGWWEISIPICSIESMYCA
ncbi:hypothetical protein TNCV_2067491 [Trichonephila clavipes]|uniref:Uncharacterized protein n=1 Tax=Trichonephila clavipes TaxID=2585209 RepID=A0A8X6W2K0_TRICX|nr:hypothetical protein TNCV_2067491 [Trichonephila clavipes]